MSIYMAENAGLSNERVSPDRSEARAYSITVACEKLGGISRSTMYRKLEVGEISARKLGSRTVIMAAEINRYLDSLPPLVSRSTSVKSL